MAKQDLNNTKAINKLKELAEKVGICMMCTNLDDRPFSSRPMSLKEVDEKGRLWFLSSKKSDKNQELNKNADVQLIFSNEKNMEFLSIYGKAVIYANQSTNDEYWSGIANIWFDGKSDPDVSVIGIEPIDVKYWDTKHGKIVSSALFAYSAITGEKIDQGEEGKLNV